jgi:hypothetical protein
MWEVYEIYIVLNVHNFMYNGWFIHIVKHQCFVMKYLTLLKISLQAQRINSFSRRTSVHGISISYISHIL